MRILFILLCLVPQIAFARPDEEECRRAFDSGIELYDCVSHIPERVQIVYIDSREETRREERDDRERIREHEHGRAHHRHRYLIRRPHRDKK